jgi:hypothetical protein
MIQSIGICRARLKAKEGENPQVASRRGGTFRNTSVPGGNNCFSVIDARVDLYPVVAAMKLPPGYLSNPAKKWTSEEDERLLYLKAKGLTLRLIAKSLNRTGASADSRLRTLRKAEGEMRGLRQEGE